jgi:hypothetical protein
MLGFFLDNIVPEWMASWYFIIGMLVVAGGLVGLLIFMRMRGTGEE